MRFWEHVEELRVTLVRMGLVVVLSALVAFIFHKSLFSLLLAPLETAPLKHEVLIKERFTAARATTLVLPSGQVHLAPGESIDVERPKQSFYLFSPLDGFVAVLKVSFWAGLALSSPLWLLFLLRFIAPALRTHEQRFVFPFLGLSLLFISLGIAFAYFVSLPLVTGFFQRFNEGIGENMWGLGQTLHFALTLILAHGLVFELYVGLLFLIRLDLVRCDQLKRARRAVIVVILLTAAVVTPPDILSQLLLAVPMLLLYESAVLYARLRRLINDRATTLI
ncbi:MAG: Sec-independent protein translocase protein TatC [Chlamydiales bacterium]|nr:Sec-independent protein translocase protein TatC [Chlamydiales bacterium]